MVCRYTTDRPTDRSIERQTDRQRQAGRQTRINRQAYSPPRALMIRPRCPPSDVQSVRWPHYPRAWTATWSSTPFGGWGTREEGPVGPDLYSVYLAFAPTRRWIHRLRPTNDCAQEPIDCPHKDPDEFKRAKFILLVFNNQNVILLEKRYL